MMNLKVVGVPGVAANVHLLNTVAKRFLYTILLSLVLYVPSITTSVI
jgi:hypothetical protein